MVTSVDFIEYVCGQIEGAGEVRCKKMFGEYMVYVNNKPILFVCDKELRTSRIRPRFDFFYIKKSSNGEELFGMI